ncbi:13705_t:CDS:2 [Entrophospora sp. SA101]|nr:2574_t:CDS:2 [Entrophospora sp. SA101]CAJ0904708.1 13705_t:CDS:2 [Entrophospora sp. SA101]
MNKRLIVENALLPSLYDNKNLEIRLSYWKPDTNYNDNNIDIGQNSQTVKGVTISHPYGPLGGDFHNNVVRTVEDFFLRKGYLTIAFNFRGSGKSAGRTSWSGEPECYDYKTIVEFLLNSGKLGNKSIMSIPKISELTIIGYSYGSLISSSLQSLLPPSTTLPISYAFISYPLSYRRWIQENKLLENKNWTVKELTDVDHFFASQRMEDELVGAIDEWIEKKN